MDFRNSLIIVLLLILLGIVQFHAYANRYSLKEKESKEGESLGSSTKHEVFDTASGKIYRWFDAGIPTSEIVVFTIDPIHHNLTSSKFDWDLKAITKR